MPRKTKADGSVPRAPRARKKNSTNQEHVKPIVEPSIYDPMMGMNGMNNMMMDESLYAHPHHHPPPHHLPHHHPHHAPIPHPHAHPHAHPHGPPPPDYSYGYAHQPPYAQDTPTNNPYLLASNQPPSQPPPQANLQQPPNIPQQPQPPGVLQQTLQGQAPPNMIKEYFSY
ncbi:unnamed protein product [Auanema sp. JU1783]|nr:unnamed protein product [Auanema sp. JU1783]